jgi:hypothetical protein
MGDKALPLPSNIGMFGCHLIISTLLQKIILFRESSTGNVHNQEAFRDKYAQLLQRWQVMWEKNAESLVSHHCPPGPMLFNGTALLRVAYVRLAIDFCPIRRAFSCFDSIQMIESRISAVDMPVRSPQTTKAAMQSCLALEIPIRLGFKIVARTSFWIWSVQHALSYFECALLLAKWVQVIQISPDLSADEQIVLNTVQDLVDASSVNEYTSSNNESALASRILWTWAKLLDTADTTVWRIQPKLAQVLKLHAERLSSI